MSQQNYERKSHFSLGIRLLKIKALDYEEYLNPTECFIGKKLSSFLLIQNWLPEYLIDS